MGATKHIEDMDVFSEYKNKVLNRMTKYNQNWLAIMVGGTGTGKSWTVISLADKMSANGFVCKYHLAFTPKQLMEIINSGKLKTGDIIIFEEAGVGMSSKEWFTLQNKLLAYLMQTFRDMNIGVIFTVPAMKFVDSSARVLFHTRFDTVDIHRRAKLCEIKVYDLEYSNHNDKLYTKIPKFVDDEGNLVYMPKIFVPLARKELLDEYERLSKEYKASLRADIGRQIDEMDRQNNNYSGCTVCGKSAYQHNSTKGFWRCRMCGEVSYDNPYKRQHT